MLSSVVVETSSLESESRPRPERVESESRPRPKRVESESRPRPERLDNLRLGLKTRPKDIFKNM